MNRDELIRKFTAWTKEYESIVGEDYGLPKRYFEFIAERLTECGAVEEPADMVCTTDGKKVRILGFDQRTKRLRYEAPDGTGFGLMPVDAVHSQYKGKLAAILDKLEGKSV